MKILRKVRVRKSLIWYVFHLPAKETSKRGLLRAIDRLPSSNARRCNLVVTNSYALTERSLALSSVASP